MRIDRSQKCCANVLSTDTGPTMQLKRTIMGNILYRFVEFLNITDAGRRADVLHDQNRPAAQQCFQLGDHIARLLQTSQSLDKMSAYKPEKLIGELCQCERITTDREATRSSGGMPSSSTVKSAGYRGGILKSSKDRQECGIFNL